MAIAMADVVMTPRVQARHFRLLEPLNVRPVDDGLYIAQALDAHRENAPTELSNTVLFILPTVPAGTVVSPNPPCLPVGIPWGDITAAPYVYLGQQAPPAPGEESPEKIVMVDHDVIGLIITTVQRDGNFVVQTHTPGTPAVTTDARFLAPYDRSTGQYKLWALVDLV